MSRKDDHRHFMGFAFDLDTPSVSKSERTTIEMTRRELFQCAMVMVIGMLLAYAVGLYTGTRFEKHRHPTAHVEVQSDQKGATNGR